MKPDFSLLILFLLSVVCLPGCGCRIISWGRSVVNQGRPLPDYACQVSEYVRSTAAYNQFALLARFDALWLSDEVLRVLAASWGCKHCVSEREIDNYYNQELKMRPGLVSFYVLSLYDVPLDTEDPAWIMSLDIDGCTINPREIEKINLPFEHALYFGKSYSRFKVPYQVTFDLSSYQINIKDESCIKLLFRSAVRQVELVWNLDELLT